MSSLAYRHFRQACEFSVMLPLASQKSYVDGLAVMRSSMAGRTGSHVLPQRSMVDGVGMFSMDSASKRSNRHQSTVARLLTTAAVSSSVVHHRLDWLLARRTQEPCSVRLARGLVRVAALEQAVLAVLELLPHRRRIGAVVLPVVAGEIQDSRPRAVVVRHIACAGIVDALQRTRRVGSDFKSGAAGEEDEQQRGQQRDP